MNRLYTKLNFSLFGLTLLLVTFLSQQMNGQCTQQVLHTSGTVQIGCTSVTVIPNGVTNPLSFCGQTPFLIGTGNNGGSFTFFFSPPVSGVSLGLTTIDNQGINNSMEEVRFEINGAFYPITIPGTPGNCNTPAIITPTGTVGAVVGSSGDWNNMNINTTISSIKVEDLIIVGNPNGVVFSLFFCPSCCNTNSGEISASPLNLCPGTNAVVPSATQTFLESNDILRYILFSNLNDTLGSIIATSITPSFSFNAATMQTGINYYIAAIAGNNLNGNINLNDPCLDISNAIQVIWHLLPTVVFSVANPNVCAGACTTVTATFTGTAPFTLTYTSSAGTNTQVFSGNSGSFNVCPPSNFSGGFVIQASAIADAFCACP